jgi:hypothetical protein
MHAVHDPFPQVGDQGEEEGVHGGRRLSAADQVIRAGHCRGRRCDRRSDRRIRSDWVDGRGVGVDGGGGGGLGVRGGSRGRGAADEGLPVHAWVRGARDEQVRHD